MSVSVGRERRRKIGSHRHDSPWATAFLWAVSAAILAVAAPGRCASRAVKFGCIELALWAAIVATVDLVPVRVWGSVSVSMSFPVALAAGMIFPPAEAALIAFAGSFDPRELKGGVSLAKSVFNRSQVAASVMAGSALFQ